MAAEHNPDYTLIVARKDLRQAIKTATLKVKKRDPGYFEISYFMGQMTCTGMIGSLMIPAQGEWINPVRTSAVAMKTLSTKLPEADPLRLTFRDDRLYVENFSVQAFVKKPG